MALLDPTTQGEVDLTAALVDPGKAPRNSSRARLIWLRLRSTPRFWVGAVIVVGMIVWAIAGLWIAKWSPLDQDLINSSTGPSTSHWFGTDDIGQDIYAETVSGLRKSLVIGLIAGPVGTLIAAFVGAFAGYLGGKADAVISWLINFLLVLPAFFILVLLSPVFKSLSFLVLTAFIAMFSWMIMAQVIRAQTKSLRDREFVKAARFMGVGTPTIIRRHILPNVASLLIIDATLGVVAAIDSETALSYFGFGIQRPQVSLGVLLADGTPSATTRPWMFLFPAIVLIVLLFAVSLVGDALRDAVDPTSGNTRD
ncbi:MAG: peptide transporter permease [Marmoricola sp.]|jgi:peptide/nickel transport system permease protein|nr:peptide transporter permease [Marmoricola sp.]